MRANDPDGDPLVYSLSGQPAGMSIDSRLGQIRWSPESTDAGSYSFDVEVSDGRGGIDNQRINLVVGPDESAPQVTLTLDPSPVDVGGSVTILVSAVDDIEVTSLSLFVDGVVVPLDRDGRAVVQADAIGVRSVVATAADPSGNVGEASEQLLIRDPSDVNAPTVRIDVPADGETITSPTDVIGTVTDDNLLSYTLSYAAYGSGDFTEIVTGTEAIVDGVIGRFDPTLLVNGSYVVRLEATDIGGATSVAEQVVDVAGELKIGNFALSFTDLSVPVSGIPITVSRTYDSLTSRQQDDLGYGWRLEFRDTDLRTRLLPTGLEEEFIYNPLYDSARVYVTLPGGIREGFTFRLKPAP